MAESVDAMVSNTIAFTGMPVRLRLWVLVIPLNSLLVRMLRGIFALLLNNLRF